MAGYISSFKKFMKSEEKKAEEVGANPSIEEQADATPATPDNTADQAAQTTTQAPASVESDPAVIAARQAAAQAIANRDKVIAAKQKELNDLKAAQDALVNTANTNLNNALATTAKKETSTT